MLKIILFRNKKPIRWFGEYFYINKYIKILGLSLDNSFLTDQYSLTIVDTSSPEEEMNETNSIIINQKIKYYGKSTTKRYRGCN